MRCNREVALDGAAVALVPYRPEHVPTYNAWMADPWLREMTASEPLSLEEEYAMCESWQQSEDKLTFIVLDRADGAMAGDVNLFFHPWLREEGQAEHAVAEVEVMIGEPAARRKGLASEALQLMMDYAAAELGTRRFVAKIKMVNEPSLALFGSKLGFTEVDRDEGFGEVEMHRQQPDGTDGAAAARVAAAKRASPLGGKVSGNELWSQMGRPRYVVAPMVDQSELAFRMMCRKYGATLAYTPMVHARLFNEDKHYAKEFFTTAEGDRPLFVQFCGNDPQTLLNAALKVQDHCDAVDLNLGCPQQIARRGNYGAFLAQDLPRVLEIVSTLHRGLRVPVACKIRVQDQLEDTLSYAKALVEAGCQILCVHGRTRESGRHGLASWEAIRAVKEAVDVPVIANGNIRCLEDCEECLRRTGADAVMSAETLLENPALFQPLPAQRDQGGAGAEAERLMLPPWDLAVEYCEYARRYMSFAKNTPHLGMVRGHLIKLLHQQLAKWPDLRDRLTAGGLGTMDPSPLYAAAEAVRARAREEILGPAATSTAVGTLLVPAVTRAEAAAILNPGGRHAHVAPKGVDDAELEAAGLGGLFGDEEEDEWGEAEESDVGVAAEPRANADLPPGFFAAPSPEGVPDYVALALPYADRFGEGLLAAAAAQGQALCFLVRPSQGEPNHCMTLSWVDDTGTFGHSRIVRDATQPQGRQLWLRWKDEQEYEAACVEELVEQTVARDGFKSITKTS